MNLSAASRRMNAFQTTPFYCKFNIYAIPHMY
jgi:hypothetical protein